ncbi:hypothetical protein [Gemmatimonas sp.]|uniref:hypothetical protein n=1 Tax=Gemmatimonas sp. TaxID=1962908 RepID=UPI0025BD8DDD|nr:hypothetical protein [Gemmatimonas sp.]MCA2991888.1 HNH endonuclease [Gemmatimonas sp.]
MTTNQPPTKPINAPASAVAIQLADGSWTWVDSDTAEQFADWKWRLRDRRGYVAIRRGGVRLSLHRAIVGATAGEIVHHLDGNPRHNWRANLVRGRARENAQVRRKRQNVSSRFQGVHWDSQVRRWRASIMVDGHNIRLGRFTNELDAAIKRDVAATLLRDPPFLVLNAPEHARLRRVDYTPPALHDSATEGVCGRNST